MAPHLELEKEKVSWFCAWLDSGKAETLTLLRWLDGIDWPDESFEAPYRMLLESLPLRQRSMPRYCEKLARVASRLLGELAAARGYPPKEISHRALSELFFLCACLALPEILAKSLAEYYAAIVPQGPDALGETTRFALRIALERNQIDDRMNPVWFAMMRGDENFLPGNWEDGFAALGRSFHANILRQNFFAELSSRPPIGPGTNQFSLFREALLLLEQRGIEMELDEKQRSALLDSALVRWEAACPSLREMLRALILDSCYRPEFPAWIRVTLERRLQVLGALLLDQIILEAAEQFGCGTEAEHLMPDLLETAHQLLEDQSLSIITEKRLRNIARQAVQAREPHAIPTFERTHDANKTSFSKAEFAGFTH